MRRCTPDRSTSAGTGRRHLATARRALRESARLALLAHGDEALERLDEKLADESTPQNISRHLPRTIHRFEPAMASAILMRSTSDPGAILVNFMRSWFFMFHF